LTSFEFLSVLISVVVGLGVAHLLTGIGQLIHRSETARLSAAHLIWTFWVFLFLVVYWWTVVFGYQDWQNWNIVVFLFVLMYGVLIFLMAVILFPPNLPEPWDLRAHFIGKRRWFFGIFALLVLTELTDTGLKNHFDEFSIPYFILMGSWILLAILGWFTSGHRTQGLIAGYCLISLLSWVGYQLRDLEWVIAS
jgi:hypothetical protein